MMRLYNTLTRKVEEFVPAHPPKVEMFVCGPTVYDLIHMGNARTFTIFDVLASWLRYRDYNVTYLQNITDIDDKIIARANREHEDPLALAERYYNEFMADSETLGNTAVSGYVRATEHIELVLKQVKTLRDKGYAYLIDGDGWYFDLSKFKDYGKLSGRTTLKAGDAVSRIDASADKRNPGDFVIWKLSKPGEPRWEDANLGAGRPGWHIEDTAMTEHHFGPQYDLHGGAMDLLFPHHEAEIALQEAASGLVPFVRHWVHAGFLQMKGEKMSKSIGNIISLRQALERWSPSVLRLFFLGAHYRSPLVLDDKPLEAAQAGVHRLSEFAARVRHAERGDGDVTDIIVRLIRDFQMAMDDDLNTPKAIGSLFELVRHVNTLMDESALSAASAERVEQFIETVSGVLGIISDSSLDIPDSINTLVAEREAARENKDFEKSDRVRETISEKGWTIDDTQYGPLVKRKP